MSAAAAVIEDAIARRVFPGAALGVAVGGRIVSRRCFGQQRYSAGAAAVTLDLLYDLASLTKVLATTSVTAVLVGQGQLALDDRVRRYLPELRGPGPELSLADLLAHRGGYPAEIQLCQRSRPEELTEESVAGRRARLLSWPPSAGEDWAACGARVRYSDVGFLILGLLIEAVTGTSLARAAERLVFEPLGIPSAGLCYGPVAAARAAPSERRPWGAVVQGSVHDENAAALGGVAGHAGLFGSLDGVLALALAWAGQGEFLSEQTRRLFLKRQQVPEGCDRALGWAVNSSVSGKPGAAFPEDYVGHNGFTGCALWLREGGHAMVLLSNRTWPRRPAAREGSAAILDLRRRVHEALAGDYQELTAP